MIEPVVSKPMIRRLEWDCNHFGLSVAHILGDEWDDAALGEALADARRERYELVYWATSSDRPIAKALLVEFRGSQVDQKATFVRRTMPEVDSSAAPPPAKLAVGSYAGAKASQEPGPTGHSRRRVFAFRR